MYDFVILGISFIITCLILYKLIIIKRNIILRYLGQPEYECPFCKKMKQLMSIK